jgi:hypothetical protein
MSNPASRHILNIVELQNVITAASGLTPIQVLSNQVQNIATMVNYDLKRINVNTIAKYNKTPITVIDDINLCNVNLYKNGVLFSGGGYTAGSVYISSGTSGIALTSNSVYGAPAITFTVGKQPVFGITNTCNSFFSGSGNFLISSPATFTLSGNGADVGKSLLSLNNTGRTTWGYVSTLACAPTGRISFQSGLGSEVARFAPGGYFGLGTSTPSVRLEVNGSSKVSGNIDIDGSCSAFSFFSLSDRRFKEDIVPLVGAGDIIGRLRAVRFNWIDLSQNDIGMIAQELQEVVPEAVAGTSKLSVAYHKLIPVLVEAVKELQQRITQLEGVILKLPKDQHSSLS